MSAQDDSRKGICILSFDSGGAGTYSQLLILKEYMHRIAVDSRVSIDDLYPADYFDFMGGVGFGGLVALMLGRLRMNVSQAMDALEALASTVFLGDSQEAIDREGNSKRLEEVIEGMLQAREISLDAKMNDQSRSAVKCKVVLYASASSNITHPRAFRTYSSRGTNLNPTIVEAVCATMAAPSHFLPVTIGSRLRKINFVGGPLGANNPTRELLKEAGTAFGSDKRVVQIISIGCGAPATLSLEALTNEAGADLLKTAADCQVVARELSTRLFNVDAYLRLNVDRGIESTSLEDWSMLGDIETHTGIYTESNVVTEFLDASWTRVRQNIGSITLGQLNHSSGVKVVAKTAPAVSRHFVLRKKESELMVRHLITLPSSGQKIFPITGMGGCGKTQMVSYFLQEHSSLYARSVYVNANSSDSIKSDLQTWARALGDGHERDEWEDGFRILANIPLDERLVLTLDNADDSTLDLVPFIPKNTKLTVIITSRNRDVGNLSTTYHLEMGEMVADEALSTLLQAARRELPLPAEEMESVLILMKELGCLPVALVQAGTYCHQLSDSREGSLPYTFTQYLSLFYLHRAELMKLAEPSSLDSYQRGAYTTLDLSYRALPRTTQEFLHFISFFHHTDIPLRALEIAANAGFKDRNNHLPRPESHQVVVSDLRKLLCSEDGKWNELQMQLTIRTLRSSSLISATSINDSIFLQMHPLIQSWSRDSVISTSQHYRAMAIQVLTICSRVHDGARLHRYLLAHVLDMLEQKKGYTLHVNDMMSVGRLLTDQGHYQNATALFEMALETMKTAADQPEENNVIAILSWLAGAYAEGGRWIEAEKLQLEVLEQQTRILGEEHPDTIMAAANLAATYSQLGRWVEAEKLQVRALEQRTRILGEEHPDTIMAAANLAATYSQLGRWVEAEKLKVRALEQRTRILGEEHPDTIMAAANLARTYADQGRWVEAEKLQVRALEQRTRILGEEHPDTIRAAANLAATYSQLGRWVEAEKLKVRALEQRTRILGEEHPDTIRAAANLARTYADQGRWIEAEKLEVRALEQRTRILGEEHPDTIRAAANLAATYSQLGRWVEAEKLQVRALEQRTRILGEEHPDTIRAAANLAATYSQLGRWVEAEKLKVRALEQRTRILGEEHPDTIMAAANLAATYSQLGRWVEAEKLKVRALEQRTRILGEEHPDTIMAAANLARTYADQGRWVEAEKLQVRALEQRTRILGEEHPDTIRAAANLARTYADQGRWIEAEKLEVRALEQRTRILGEEHPDTIRAAANLAATYSQLGRWVEAEKLEVRALEQRTRILGEEHPDTIRAAANLACTYADQGRWEDATALLAPAVSLSLKLLGQENPNSQARIKRLASLYEELGRRTEAQEMRGLLLS